jgi:hypothetical protein
MESLVLAAIPILIELFTSEGCSSCPPADAVLARLHEKRPDLVVLSEHVDYWNNLGWRDPFSARLFTERQEGYGGRVYTPQVMVDGRVDVLGSDEQGIVKAAEAASAEPHGTVAVAARGKGLHIGVKDLPKHGPAQVFVAVLEDGLVSKVLHGENEGRTLSHTAVVRSLKGAGSIAATAASWEGDVEIPTDPAWKHTRVAVFVQDRESLRVLASGSM